MATRRPEEYAARRRRRWNSPEGRVIFYGLVTVLATGEFVVLSTGFPHRGLSYSAAALVGLALGGVTWGSQVVAGASHGHRLRGGHCRDWPRYRGDGGRQRPPVGRGATRRPGVRHCGLPRQCGRRSTSRLDAQGIKSVCRVLLPQPRPLRRPLPHGGPHSDTGTPGLIALSRHGRGIGPIGTP